MESVDAVTSVIFYRETGHTFRPEFTSHFDRKGRAVIEVESENKGYGAILMLGVVINGHEYRKKFYGMETGNSNMIITMSGFVLLAFGRHTMSLETEIDGRGSPNVGSVRLH